MRRRWEEQYMLKKVFWELAAVVISSVTRVISACSLMLNLKKKYVSIYLYTHMCVHIKRKKYIWRICEVWSDSIQLKKQSICSIIG